VPAASLADHAVALWPWLVFPLVVLWRTRGSRTLDDEPAAPPPPDEAPPATIVIPARDEATTIAACVRAALATRWPALSVVVVDDGSRDGTAALAREAGDGDPRLAIVPAPPLPDGWMGKQWACATGAAHARIGPGALLLFVDADTQVAPDLLARAAHLLRRRRFALLSVVGRQRMEGFWERVVQPQVLVVLAARYGSTERVTRARRADGKVANGQCLLVRRDAYDAIGGHAAVRDSVSEDLMLAQRMFGAGHEVGLVLAPRQLATRMYDSLGAIVRGWRKNVYAGGREAMPLGRAGRAIFPLLLLFPPAFSLVPPMLALLGLAGLAGPFTLHWSALACLLLLGWWALAYRRLGLAAAWAATWPLGAGVLLWIVLGALARGSRVEWRGRVYRSR
jgi:chlorobactene glucosyltransferase